MASPAPLLLLRVKRKATEAPVEAIEVTGAKKRKTGAVFRLKSEDASRKRKSVGGGGGDAKKEDRKRFRVLQADGDAKVVDLVTEDKGDVIACNGVEMVREKVEAEEDKFVFDEYYADGVVYEDFFGGKDDGDDDFVVREYLDEYADLKLDFRVGRGSDCEGDSDSNDEGGNSTANNGLKNGSKTCTQSVL